MNGIDFSQFDELIGKVEQLGADMDAVAERVLDAGCGPAMEAFKRNVPYDTVTPPHRRKHEHARDHVTVSRTRKSKYGNKYRTIGANGEEFVYLFYLENGTSTMPAKPFRERAYRDARAAASEPMRQALIKEIENHLR